MTNKSNSKDDNVPEKLSDKLKDIKLPDDSISKIHRRGDSADFGESDERVNFRKG
jgi:hypothetical protein